MEKKRRRSNPIQSNVISKQKVPFFTPQPATKKEFKRPNEEEDKHVLSILLALTFCFHSLILYTLFSCSVNQPFSIFRLVYITYLLLSPLLPLLLLLLLLFLLPTPSFPPHTPST
jgi:phosphoglycerol transferase MdoB-like AlkP superfamily enzyme